jgi:hypothetical protein
MKKYIAKYYFLKIVTKIGEECTPENEHDFSESGFIEFNYNENPLKKIKEKYGIDCEFKKADYAEGKENLWVGSQRIDQFFSADEKGNYNALYQICFTIYEEIL